VTVSGAGIANPKNLLVPIGISYGELVDYCGGLRENAARVVAGGPMMGFTLGNLDTPVTKGTSGLTVLTHADVSHAQETNCVRCGRCVDVCPLNLVPTKLALASRHEDWDLAKRHHLMACMECGCCAYACPASLPLVQLMRVAKAKMPRD
jgi:electron transport complex protein RnfC